MNKQELKERAEKLKVGRGRLVSRFLDEIVEDGLSKCRKGTLTIIDFGHKKKSKQQIQTKSKNDNLSSNGYDLSDCPF